MKSSDENDKSWQQGVAHVAETARDKLGEVGDAVEGYYEKGMEKAREIRSDLQTHVKENPLKAVLIAAGISVVAGLLIGVLTTRR